MTDAVIDGGASAPAEVAIIPTSDAAGTPRALGSQIPEADTQAAEPPKAEKPTIDQSIDKALARQAEKAAKPEPKEPPKTEAKPVDKAEAKPVPKVAPPTEEKPQQQRGEHGHFAKSTPQGADGAGTDAGKEQQPSEGRKPYHDAPSRFLDHAKADWAGVPDTVKEETHRAITNLENGLREHQERWEPVREYHDLAKQHGTTLPEAMKRYVAMDRQLSANLLDGLEGVIRDKTGGQYGLREIAAHVMGQKADPAQVNQDNNNHQTNSRFDRIENAISGLVGHLRTQAETTTKGQVQQFADGKDDFEVLAPQIAEHIRGGLSLEDAYAKAKTDAEELARKLGFIAPSDSASKTAKVDTPPTVTPVPLNPAGQKSIAGPPSTGAQPQRRKGKLPSIDETLSRISVA